MRHAAFAVGLFAVCACAKVFAAAPVMVGEEGGGMGGSLEDPENDARRVRPLPNRGAEPRGGAAAIYSYPINTQPDGWAALKAEPWGNAQRLTKVYDGTLFLVIGQVPGWKLVQFKSGERGWIAERLVGCCRPASH